MKHMHDAESRAIIDKACAEIAKVLSDRDMWRAPWRIEVDGCVFKFKIDGYPKRGTPKDVERQRYLAELSAEADAHEAAVTSNGSYCPRASWCAPVEDEAPPISNGDRA